MRYAFFAATIIATLILAGCTDQAPEENGRLRVVASFYPLYDFATNVGGDRVDVSTLMPAGMEPHEFEPTPGDIRKIEQADVFIYNGAGMEPWAGSVVEGTGKPQLVVVDASRGIEIVQGDPHVWLDPILARKQVENIRDAFIEADPEGRAEYEKNAAEYSAKLDALGARISTTMSTCAKRDLLITHSTLGYFCRRYGCNQIAITGINPEAEPSAGDVAEIVRQAHERNVSAVFFESLIDPKTANTIAQEIGGYVLMFNSVHGLSDEEATRGENYITLMDGNLANIKKGLMCN